MHRLGRKIASSATTWRHRERANLRRGRSESQRSAPSSSSRTAPPAPSSACSTRMPSQRPSPRTKARKRASGRQNRLESISSPDGRAVSRPLAMVPGDAIRRHFLKTRYSLIIRHGEGGCGTVRLGARGEGGARGTGRRTGRARAAGGCRGRAGESLRFESSWRASC